MERVSVDSGVSTYANMRFSEAYAHGAGGRYREESAAENRQPVVTGKIKKQYPDRTFFPWVNL